MNNKELSKQKVEEKEFKWVNYDVSTKLYGWQSQEFLFIFTFRKSECYRLFEFLKSVMLVIFMI